MSNKEKGLMTSKHGGQGTELYSVGKGGRGGHSLRSKLKLQSRRRFTLYPHFGPRIHVRAKQSKSQSEHPPCV